MSDPNTAVVPYARTTDAAADIDAIDYAEATAFTPSVFERVPLSATSSFITAGPAMRRSMPVHYGKSMEMEFSFIATQVSLDARLRRAIQENSLDDLRLALADVNTNLLREVWSFHDLTDAVMAWGSTPEAQESKHTPLCLFRELMTHAHDDGSGLRVDVRSRRIPDLISGTNLTSLQHMHTRWGANVASEKPTRPLIHAMLTAMIDESERLVVRQHTYRTTLGAVVATALHDSGLQDFARVIGGMCVGYLVFQ